MMKKIAFTLLAITLVTVFNGKSKLPHLELTKQDSTINLSPTFYKFSSLGHERLVSSLLWIITNIESDLTHYKEKNLNSWMYLRFNQISILDPTFYENYYFGGTYLSIIKDDEVGAEKIFAKGLQHFPNDFQLLFQAAYHYLVELKDHKSAIKLYSRLVQNPKHIQRAPRLLSFYAKLLKEHNDDKTELEVAREVYENAKRSGIQEIFIEHYFKKYQSLLNKKAPAN